MSEDLIRRSDAIKAIKREKSDWNNDYNVPIDHCIERLNKVKSADRPQGEWIEKIVDDVKITVCSSCDKEPTFTHFYGSCGNYSLSDFCPNCGADMREREGE